MITIILVDDHHLVRMAFADLLSAQMGMEVVGQASTVAEAQELVKAARPQVVILDLMLPDENGSEFALHLLEHYPEIRVVIVSSRLEPAEVLSLVRAGIHGYVAKTSRSEELVQAVRAVILGEHYFAPVVASALSRGLKTQKIPNPQETLTQRQTAILERIAKGMNTQQIALDLSLSRKTIEKYRGEILRTLSCKNSLQAVDVARKQNLIDV